MPADLFDKNLEEEVFKNAPLAERMRPRDFSQFEGQGEIVGENKLLRKLIENDDLVSIIFWGPPGTGKTTLAKIIANVTDSSFIQFSAVTSGVKDLRGVIKQAKENRKFYNKKTILFIDEIHRWNKSQQDALLPYVENGTIILIGATTENPSFEINSALLSRSRVFVLKLLSGQNIANILVRTLKDKENGLGKLNIKINKEIIKELALISNGDARIALNALEFAVKATKPKKGIIELNQKIIKEALQKTHLLYDKAGEEHYNIISALHKSLRGSNVDASLYWLGRMLEAGEDPLYIARRLVRFASEDVGMADPNALVQSVAAYQACHFIGMPECDVILAQAAVYLAKAPKSNDLYAAYNKVKKDIKETENEPVPLHLRNAPTKLMENLGYGKGYKYNPDYNYKKDIQDYLPKKLKGRKYFKG